MLILRLRLDAMVLLIAVGQHPEDPEGLLKALVEADVKLHDFAKGCMEALVQSTNWIYRSVDGSSHCKGRV